MTDISGRLDTVMNMRSGGTDLKKKGIPVREEEIQLTEATKDKFHADGHATADEACECYRQYLLDHRLILNAKWDAQYKCKVCGEWTQCHASVGNTFYINLCETHNNRVYSRLQVRSGQAKNFALHSNY